MSSSSPQRDETPADPGPTRRTDTYNDPREPGFFNAVWKSMMMFPTVVILAVVALVIILWFLFT